LDKIDEHERLEKNKELARHFMELVVNPATAPQARAFLTDNYVQHNPNLPDGPDAILNFAAMEEGKMAKETMTISGPARFIAEGDFVIMTQPLSRPDPVRPGENYTMWWFDMWRVEDGKLAEHWDADQKQLWSLRK
jgi:predicted SnoaL-like aldol condensation-catalyzing enzyme